MARSLLGNGLRVAVIAALATTVGASAPSPSVREHVRANERAILAELTAFLAVPNEASDRDNIRKNAALLVEMMRRRGLEPRLLEASDPSAPPAVFGERRVEGATRTLVFYAHYDGQPADPEQWTGSRPWEPVLRSGPLGAPIVPLPPDGTPLDPEWRVFARSASDDKAGVLAILSAVDALDATGQRPTANLKFFFEGEEEAGSPHLGDILARHKGLLASDAWIICDGPVHQSGRKQVVFGVRGDVNVDVTVYGPIRPLHSGHYGNWAPNPAMQLARLLATMKDEAGRVTIEGWYDDVEPLGDLERRAVADAPRDDDRLRAELAVGRPEGGGASLLDLLLLPSLNVNGFRSADVGDRARNVIPTTATATLDLRLVKGNDRDRQVRKLVRHVERQGVFVVDREPTAEERRSHPLVAKIVVQPGGYNASRTRMDLPVSRAVTAAVESVSASPVVRLPSLGGSLPLVIFNDALGATTITVPIANHDNNQHAENENLRLRNLWEGIEIMSAIMTMAWQ
jgi:acetylornithine deacetylase/succinyl-diaminopimelate desuccinylase-like protein